MPGTLKTDQGPVRLTAEIGRSGLTQYGGYIADEFDADLRGIRGIRVYDEMRRNDPTIAVGLRAIDWVLGQVNWTVRPGGETPADQEAAAFLDSCRNDMSVTWGRLIQDALTCLPFGFAWCEVTYKQRAGGDADPPSRYDDGRIGWRKIALVGQSSLARWAMDPDGGIRGFIQVPDEGRGEVTIPIEKSLLFRLDAERNNPEGISLLRPCYLPWYSKKQIQEIEAIGIERDLTGVLIIHLPAGATSTDKDKAIELLEQYKADDMTGFLAPQFGPGEHERWRFEIVNSPGSKSIDSDKVIGRYQLEIARTFLVQFLMLGATQTGSFSLGQSQRDLFEVALGAVLNTIAETMNRYLVPVLFRLNDFGRLAGLPMLSPGRISKGDMERFAKGLAPLVQAGILSPDRDLEQFVRQEMDLPELPEPVEKQTPTEDTGQQAPKRQAEEPPEPDLPDPDDEEAWRRFEEESNKRIERSGKRRKASGLLAFARPYNYGAKLAEHTEAFRARMQELAQGLRDGTVTRGDWSYQSRTAIMSHTIDGYRLGVAQATGMPPSKVKLTPGQRQAANGLVREQWSYFKDFQEKTFAKIASGEALTTAIDARAQLYGGSVRSAAAAARLDEQGDQQMRWVRNATDSCDTCIEHEGQKRTGAEWQQYGIWPAHNVTCGGNCKCELVEED